MPPLLLGRFLAGLVAVILPAAALVVGCKGAPVGPALERDAGAAGGTDGGASAAGGQGAGGRSGSGGASAAGGQGAGGRSGSGGASATGGIAGGGAGGAGGLGGAGACAPLFGAPTPFFESRQGPVAPQAIGDRFYWGEQDVMAFQGAGFSIHWAGASDPTDHRFPFNFTPSGPWDFRASASLILRTNNWDPVAFVANSTVDGHEIDRRTPVPTDMGPIAVGPDSVGYFISRPGQTPADSALMRWSPPGAPVPVVSFTDLQLDARAMVLLRVTDDQRFVLAALRQVWLADPAATTKAAMSLFTTTTGAPEEITFSSAGMLVHLASPSSDLLATLSPGPPRDLAQEITLISAPADCPSTIAHHLAGPGTLHGNRYVYEGVSGVFSVTITATGLEGLTRLTALPLQFLRVTASGALFGADCHTDNTKCRFMYVGRI